MEQRRCCTRIPWVRFWQTTTPIIIRSPIHPFKQSVLYLSFRDFLNYCAHLSHFYVSEQMHNQPGYGDYPFLWLHTEYYTCQWFMKNKNRINWVWSGIAISVLNILTRSTLVESKISGVPTYIWSPVVSDSISNTLLTVVVKSYWSRLVNFR